MKKAFLAILATLCAFAAQAVTYTWSNCDGTAASSNRANYTTLSISFFTDATVQSSLPTAGNVLLKEIAIIRRDGTQVEPTPTTVKLFDGANIVATATVNMTTDDALDMAGPGNYVRGAYHLIFDNDAIIDVTKTYTLKGYDANGAEMTGEVFGIAVVRNEPANSWVVPMRVTAESVPVPEPTALALLALGVAGLALKRKVA